MDVTNEAVSGVNDAVDRDTEASSTDQVQLDEKPTDTVAVKESFSEGFPLLEPKLEAIVITGTAAPNVVNTTEDCDNRFAS